MSDAIEVPRSAAIDRRRSSNSSGTIMVVRIMPGLQCSGHYYGTDRLTAYRGANHAGDAAALGASYLDARHHAAGGGIADRQGDGLECRRAAPQGFPERLC